jgi:hypothetical protein
MHLRQYPFFLTLFLLSTTLHPMLVLPDPHTQFLILPKNDQNNILNALTPAKLYDILPQDTKKEVLKQLFRLQNEDVETEQMSELAEKPLSHILLQYLETEKRFIQYQITKNDDTLLSFIHYTKLNDQQCVTLQKAKTNPICISLNNDDVETILSDDEIKVFKTINPDIIETIFDSKNFKKNLSFIEKLKVFFDIMRSNKKIYLPSLIILLLAPAGIYTTMQLSNIETSDMQEFLPPTTLIDKALLYAAGFCFTFSIGSMIYNLRSQLTYDKSFYTFMKIIKASKHESINFDQNNDNNDDESMSNE